VRKSSSSCLYSFRWNPGTWSTAYRATGPSQNPFFLSTACRPGRA